MTPRQNGREYAFGVMISLIVLKLGLIRFATSLLVVLLAHVLNRVLIVELAVPASLVTFCFAFQHVMTPVGLVSGYLSDKFCLGRWRRLPYILGGMALSLAVMPLFPSWAQAWGAAPGDSAFLYEGILLFSLFGAGTTISATAINALLVDQVPEAQRGVALSFVWILTLAGFIVGAALFRKILPVYDGWLLRDIFLAFTLAVAALTLWGAWGVEDSPSACDTPPPPALALVPVLRLLGKNRQALLFFAFLAATVFFMSIQTFILTAYGGEALRLSVADTAMFGVITSYGTLAGMLAVYVVHRSVRPLSDKTILSLSLVLGAVAFAALGLSAWSPGLLLVVASLGLLGFSKGLYNVGISFLTMNLAHPLFSGVFMGLWNLISGLALAAGEMLGGFLQEQAVRITGAAAPSYGLVFLLEAGGLLASLLLLAALNQPQYRRRLAELLPGEAPVGEPGVAPLSPPSSREPR